MARIKTLTHTLIILMVTLLMQGCHSSHVSSQREKSYHKPTTSQRHHPKPDYSKESTDPMGDDLVAEARRWLGTPYLYGGSSREGTDCSGLVMQLYGSVCAMKLPRTTSDQRVFCMAVPRDKTRVGDLVFFGNNGSVSHVGLYIGQGKMIHASSSRGVIVSDIDDGYWSSRFQGMGRVNGAEQNWAQLNKGKKKPSKDNTPSSTPPTEIPLEDFKTLMASTASKRQEKPAPAPPAEESGALDILDEIINEKIDSIFSNQFMD